LRNAVPIVPAVIRSSVAGSAPGLRIWNILEDVMDAMRRGRNDEEQESDHDNCRNGRSASKRPYGDQVAHL
jgi:hypothetical protein